MATVRQGVETKNCIEDVRTEEHMGWKARTKTVLLMFAVSTPTRGTAKSPANHAIRRRAWLNQQSEILDFEGGFTNSPIDPYTNPNP